MEIILREDVDKLGQRGDMVKVTAGYVLARPSVTMTSSLGEDRRAINADAFQVGVSFVYKIF